jgi:hypothetical protein
MASLERRSFAIVAIRPDQPVLPQDTRPCDDVEMANAIAFYSGVGRQNDERCRRNRNVIGPWPAAQLRAGSLWSSQASEPVAAAICLPISRVAKATRSTTPVVVRLRSAVAGLGPARPLRRAQCRTGARKLGFCPRRTSDRLPPSFGRGQAGWAGRQVTPCSRGPAKPPLRSAGVVQ